jgi:hypothetical protein
MPPDRREQLPPVEQLRQRVGPCKLAPAWP